MHGKNKWMYLIALVTMIMVVTGVYTRYGFKEDVLYSQSHLSETNQELEAGEQSLSRKQAILKATEVFAALYGVDLTEETLEMYVNLYKSTEKAPFYRWTMNWYDYMTKEYFTCEIDASTGEIIYLFSGLSGQRKTDQSADSLSKDQVERIVRFFLHVVQIEVGDITGEITYPTYEQNRKYWCQKYRFSYEGREYIMIIDCVNEQVREFSLDVEEGQ